MGRQFGDDRKATEAQKITGSKKRSAEYHPKQKTEDTVHTDPPPLNND